jgi:hypothetical protein
MVISDFNLPGIAIAPYKADPVLVIDPNAILSGAITFERFQSIAWKDRKIRERTGCMNLHELSLDNLRNPAEPLRIPASENLLGIV